MTIPEMTEVMQAYDDGKEIEFRECNTRTWYTVQNPLWNWANYEYRIKPEPQYVPYDSVFEVEKDKWFKNNITGRLSRIVSIDPDAGHDDLCVHFDFGWLTLRDLVELYTYEDGSHCGKLVEKYEP